MSKLGYWTTRGLGQPIRYLLEYVGENYEEVLYDCGPAPDFNRDCWFNVKFDQGLQFPNLPYYIDDKVRLSQTNAILKYIARKYNLDAKTPEEKIRLDLINEEINDLRQGNIQLCYKDNANFEANKKVYFNNLKQKFQQYESFIGQNQFLLGKNVSYVDFSFYEVVDQHRQIVPSMLDEFPKFKAYMARIENLPRIKEYMASSKFYRRPCNNKMAAFQ